MEDLRKVKTEDKPVYKYVAAVLRLIPILGDYFSPEEARGIAQRKESEITKTKKGTPGGGRAG